MLPSPWYAHDWLHHNWRPSFQSGKSKFVLCNDAPRAHGFSYHQLLDVKHMVIMTYFFRGDPLPPHRQLFPISSKGSFICTFLKTGQHLPQPLMNQLCGPLVWTENSPNCKCIRHAGSIQTFRAECSSIWAMSYSSNRRIKRTLAPEVCMTISAWIKHLKLHRNEYWVTLINVFNESNRHNNFGKHTKNNSAGLNFKYLIS